MNIYRKLADATACLHLIWIVMLVAGILLEFVFHLGWYRPINIVVFTTTIVSQLLWLGCPLTALEKTLRARCDSSTTYSGSFTCHYLKRFGIKVHPMIIAAQLVATLIISIVL
ncbi:MAG: DUF2784 family protein [Candidatus Pacebacteria bacterium]|nr:DUF2784 family protein [Candidatus Paceibacterota bacterium]